MKVDSLALALKRQNLRLEKYGYNEVEVKRKKNLLCFYFSSNFTIHRSDISLVFGVITAFLKHWVDTSVIFGVVVINAIIAFIQEQKVEKALESLVKMIVPYATVLRDGRKNVILSREVVPSDVAAPEAGDRRPIEFGKILEYIQRAEEISAPLLRKMATSSSCSLTLNKILIIK